MSSAPDCEMYSIGTLDSCVTRQKEYEYQPRQLIANKEKLSWCEQRQCKLAVTERQRRVEGYAAETRSPEQGGGS